LIERDGVGQVGFRHEVVQDRLAHRLLERDEESGQGGNQQKMPDADRAGAIHHADEKSHEQKSALGGDEDHLGIGAIDHGAAEGGKKHPRQPQAEPFQSQVKRRVGQLEDQPALRRGLNQRAAMAEQEAAPKNKIVAVAKGAKGRCEKHSLRRDERNFAESCWCRGKRA
jgi:hypothetical protein